MRPAVLVAGWDEPGPLPGIEAVEELGDVTFAPDAASLAARIAGSEVLFIWDTELLASVWVNAGRLRWVQSASAGVDSLLFPDLIRSEVLVTNARGIFDEAIAEWVLGAMLAFDKGILGAIHRQNAGVWEHRPTGRLAGRRLLVVGPGPIGRACARLALAAGMRAEAVGRSARGADEDFEAVHGPEGFHDALGRADHVLNALPLTPETRHLFDPAAFAAMRPSARFLNVGRGGTVDEGALTEALRQGLIAGAALDVFEEEPLPRESPLWEMENVIVSPHMSGDREGWEGAVVELFAENLDRYARGEPLRNLVDKRLGFGAPGGAR